MGSIISLKSGQYAIRFEVESDDGKRKQKQIGGFKNKKEANKELIKVEAEILNGKFFEAKDITVSEFLKIWMRDHVEPNLRDSTIRSYQSFIEKHLDSYFSKIKLSALKANHIESFYAHLKKNSNLSANSIHAIHVILIGVLNTAVKWDYIAVSPMIKAASPKLQKTEMKWWNEEEMLIAMDLFKGTFIEWHVKVALLTGLRRGEICALHSRNIDYKNKTFSITESIGQGYILGEPKTEKSKATLPLTAPVEKLFKEREQWIRRNKVAFGKKYNNDYGGYLSVSELGNMMSAVGVSIKFRGILKKQNKVKVIRFHDLRHSCATWLISQGVDLKTIQEILRHSNFATTANIYSHISVDAKKEAMEKLNLGG